MLSYAFGGPRVIILPWKAPGACLLGGQLEQQWGQWLILGSLPHVVEGRAWADGEALPGPWLHGACSGLMPL